MKPTEEQFEIARRFEDDTIGSSIKYESAVGAVLCWYREALESAPYAAEGCDMARLAVSYLDWYERVKP